MKPPYSIMLVDDDKDDQMIFTIALNEISSLIACDCFDNALSGLKKLETIKENPACIFLDLNLPLMHGFEFLQHIKSSEKFNTIPVFIYTTSSRDEDKRKANELGARNFISKPTSFTELKEKISVMLNDVA